MNKDQINVEFRREEILAKYQNRRGKARGGMFTTITRKRLLGELPEREETKTDFRYDVRERVKTALIDLELFIEFADKKDVDEVITCESLKGVVDALLSEPIKDGAEPDLARAEIAELFIETGFGYLMSMKRKELLSSGSERTIQEAIDHSKLLTASFKSEKDWTL